MHSPTTSAGEAAQRSFAAAVDKIGEVVVRRVAAGRTIELHIAGDALVDALTKAPPPAPDDSPADLTVLAWDDASSGVGFPRPAGAPALEAARGRRHDNATMPRVMEQPTERVVTLLDGDFAAVFVEDAAVLPSYVHGAPLLHALSWWLADQGGYLVHASCVGGPGGAAMFVGPGGSGKSTSALACLGSAVGYISDDYTVVTTPPQPTATSLYYSAKLHRPHLAEVSRQLGSLPTTADPTAAADDKALLMLDHAALAPGGPLRAIVLPRVGPHSSHRVSPASAGEAFTALAPSTVLQLPGVGARHLTAMRRLCEAIPAYTLELSPDIATIPDAITHLLAS